MCFEVIAVDWPHDNVLITLETRERAERCAEKLDEVGLRTAVRERA